MDHKSFGFCSSSRIFIATLILSICFSLNAINAFANGLSISNVTLEERNLSGSTVVVNFDVSWENSWKTKINHDAVWLTVRLYNPTFSPTEKKLCQISSSGLNPIGTSVDSQSGLEVYVPADRKGAFIRPAQYGNNVSIAATDVQMTVDYSSCGFASTDQVYVSVLGMEMVLVPSGAFYAGDSSSTAAFDQGSGDTDPWQIASEGAIGVSNPASNGYRYVSAGNPSEDVTGTIFTIPTSFPKGYAGFYAMKYEITEGQWVEFINSLGSSAARNNYDITDNTHKNSDTVIRRNTIACSGSPLICTTQRSARALGYLSWTDVAAFLDWAALRPITELEFEKIARGPILPESGEFAWGQTTITGLTSISGAFEDGTETASNSGAIAVYNNVSFTGGDSSNGVEYAQGPVRSGIFATSTTERTTSGAGYYGALELSGNLRERVVTVGNSQGRSFTGTHGDGVLISSSGFEGNATNSDWPGIDADPLNGVTGALGSGFKGGGWDDQLSGARLRVSDRQDAANGTNLSFSNSGARGARTYEQ